MPLVDLRIYWPWGLLMTLLRGAIVFLAAHVFLKDRFHPLVSFTTILAVSVLYGAVGVRFPETESCVMFTYYLVVFVVLLGIKRGKVFSKLMTALFALVCYQIGMLAAALLELFVQPDALFLLTQYEIPMGFFLIHLLLTLLVAIILIISVQAIQTHIRNKASGFRAKYGYFLLFPLSHLLCTLLYFRLVQTLSDEDFEHYIGQYPFIEVFLIIVFSFCLLLDFSIIFIIDRMEATEQKNVQNEKLLLQNQLNYESTLLLREEKREFQKIKHDFANILTVAQGYIEIGNTDKALSALASMQVNLAGIAGFSLCSSETLNVILYIKKTQAESVGVTLIPEIQETCGIQIEDYDLCRVLFNLIDNCLHAVELLSADKSFSIHIQVGEKEVSIHTRNRFLPEQTHRRKEDGHGNGVQIIREICAKYGGTYFAHTADDVYYTETVMQNRMPAEKTVS